MAFGLVLKSERADAFQNAIENELVKRGYSGEPDATMSEYITIMVINNKSSDEISRELEDLIGSDFDPSFTDWLFAEAQRGHGAPQEEVSEPPAPEPAPPTKPAPQPDSSRRPPLPQPRNGVFSQAISQALPTTGQKRTSSARSPSPGQPTKLRKTEPPTAPRAMNREGVPIPPNANPRSLIDRLGARQPNQNTPVDSMMPPMEAMGAMPDQAAMMHQLMASGAMPNPMEMNAMNGMNGMMANPMVLQEMMMGQMAMMAQMASSMGLLNPATGQFNAPTVNMGVPNPDGVPNGFPQGGARGGGRPRGRGRGGSAHGTTHSSHPPSEPEASAIEPPVNIVTPTPTVAAAPQPPTVAPPPPTYALPERPSSPTLCKFGLKCTNSQCRYSHPSPVATPESGVVLSNDPCEKGKDCKDADCIKAHVSPAVLNPQAVSHPPAPVAAPPAQPQMPCRFGASCTRPNCSFSHPSRPAANTKATQPCRFGAACTKASCPYEHPDGRVLPNSFHRGVSADSPTVTVKAPDTGSIGVPSPHKSMTFNKTANLKERYEKQMKELEEQKIQLEAKMAHKTADSPVSAS